MFAEIKTVIDTLKTSLGIFSAFKKQKEKDEAIGCFLKLYYMLLDVVEDGETLIREVGADPMKTIENIPEDKIESTALRWDTIVRKQAERLYSIGGWLGQTPVLAIIAPDLGEKIKEVIGTKGDRIDSLSTIGATLVVSSMFSRDNRQDQINLIKVMYREKKDGLLDLEATKTDVKNLRESLEEFRQLCVSFLDKSDILTYSKRAREVSKIELA